MSRNKTKETKATNIKESIIRLYQKKFI